jgi:hypothetical protein
MSTIPMKEIPGDVGVGRHSTIGGNATVRGEATVEHDLTVKGWFRARNIVGSCRGVYGTSDDLIRREPAPLPGMWAVVKSPTDGEITQGKIWLENHGRWVETEILLGESTIGNIWSEELYEALENSRKALEVSAQCQEGLAAETTARRSADSALSERINDESQSRTQAINQLRDYIQWLTQQLESRISDLENNYRLSDAQRSEEISELRTRVEELDYERIELDQKIDSNRELIDGLTDQLGSVNALLETATNERQEIRKGISFCMMTLGEHEEDLQTAELERGELAGRQQRQEETQQQMQDSIEALQREMDELRENGGGDGCQCSPGGGGGTKITYAEIDALFGGEAPPLELEAESITPEELDDLIEDGIADNPPENRVCDERINEETIDNLLNNTQNSAE